MPNKLVQAAAEGLPNATRRALLFSLGAASTAAALTVAPNAHAAETVAVDTQDENPDLVAAYNKFHEACVDLKTAIDHAEWLADEWRHCWPLAPEELLLDAGAQHPYAAGAIIERDIIGRPLLRDTSAMTKRLSQKFRERTPQTCFTLLTADKARELLDRWQHKEPRGRTEKSLARNRDFQQEAIAVCKRDIVIAEQYEAETARLRKLAGVDAAKQRVNDTDARLAKAAEDVSRADAYTLSGLKMKADALSVTAGKLMEIIADDRSALGQLFRFVKSAAGLAERGIA